MFTIMMLLTGMFSSLSTQDAPPSHAIAAVSAPTIYQTSFQPAEEVAVSVYPSESGIESLNGLTLQDRIEDVRRVYGEASQTVPAYMAGTEYQYSNLNVGAYENWIYYVSVSGVAGHFNLNGQELPMDAAQIRARLGTPDFTADDGFGYEHDGQAIKVFVDPLSGQVRSVDLFDTTSV